MHIPIIQILITHRKKLLAYSSAFAFIIAMVVASDITRTHEFILPEFAAMAMAMWAFRDKNWFKNPAHICIIPTITAIIGLTVNQLPLSYLLKIAMTLTAMLLVFVIFNTTFAPSLATGLLPLITNAHSWGLVMLVFILTLFFMLIVLRFEWNKDLIFKQEKKIRLDIAFLLVMLGWLAVCWFLDIETLAAIPPVIVVAYEAIQKQKYIGITAFKQAIGLLLSSVVGTVLFLYLSSWTIIIVIDILLMFLLSYIIKVRMPALYAFPLFPFILPAEAVPSLPLYTLWAVLYTFSCLWLYKKYYK